MNKKIEKNSFRGNLINESDNDLMPLEQMLTINKQIRILISLKIISKEESL